jgi:hypothetical protein
MNTQLIIDQEFRALIPPMSADSLAQLDQNIREHGLRDKLVIWDSPNGEILIDGHHRYEIINRSPHLIAYEVEKLNFENRDEVKLWILQNQIGRRNLSDDQQIAIWTDIGEQRAKVSREHQLAAARQVKSGAVADKRSATGTTPKKDIRKEIEKESGGKATVRKQRAHQEFKREQPEAYKDVRSGKKTLKQAKKQSTPKVPLQSSAAPTAQALSVASAPVPPQNLSETFYVIRRKSDGAFYLGDLGYTKKRVGSFHSSAEFSDEPSNGNLRCCEQDYEYAVKNNVSKLWYRSSAVDRADGKLSASEWEWVKVRATYQLTAVEPTKTEAPTTVATTTTKRRKRELTLIPLTPEQIARDKATKAEREADPEFWGPPKRGRKSKLTPEDIIEIKRQGTLGAKVRGIATQFKVSVGTVYNILREAA